MSSDKNCVIFNKCDRGEWVGNIILGDKKLDERVQKN